MAALASEAFDLGDGHSRHPNFRKCRAHIVQLEGFDDGSDQFHTGTPLQHWGAETILLLFCAAGTTICAGRPPPGTFSISLGSRGGEMMTSAILIIGSGQAGAQATDTLRR